MIVLELPMQSSDVGTPVALILTPTAYAFRKRIQGGSFDTSHCSESARISERMARRLNSHCQDHQRISFLPDKILRPETILEER